MVSYTVTITNSALVPYLGATFNDSLAGVLDDAAYNSDATGENELYVRSQDGKGEPTQLTNNADTYYYAAIWSPDSKKLMWSDRLQRLRKDLRQRWAAHHRYRTGGRGPHLGDARRTGRLASGRCGTLRSISTDTDERYFVVADRVPTSCSQRWWRRSKQG